MLSPGSERPATERFKSTIGALLAERLELPFLDLDRHFAGRLGDIREYIGRDGCAAYARENIEAYCSLFRGVIRRDVVALSSGFMTYAGDVHPEYGIVRREIEECASTFVLRPSLDRELCVVETVRRQVARPYGSQDTSCDPHPIRPNRFCDLCYFARPV